MAQSSSAEDLERLLVIALAIADNLHLWGVGARLDQALVDLTGVGREMREPVSERP